MGPFKIDLEDKDAVGASWTGRNSKGERVSAAIDTNVLLYATDSRSEVGRGRTG